MAMDSDSATKPLARRSRYRLGLFMGAALLVSLAARADTYSFTALPADVAGPAGSTVGWGYTISNTSTTSWLVLTALDAGVFDHGSPDNLFDFPTLAPGATVSVSFDGVNALGLYELTWDSTAPIGFVNTGFFTLQGEWWDGDPLAGGNFLTGAPDESVAYSATVTGTTSIPESSIGWVLLWIAAFVFFGRADRRRGARPRDRRAITGA